MVRASQSKILLVEDEANLGSTLKDSLEDAGYVTDWVESKAEALSALKLERYQLAVLDVGLGDGSGFDVGRVIQDNYPATAMLFLTAYSHPDDRIKGLSLGAEDYVLKPFQLAELLLRIKNCLRRGQYRQAINRSSRMLGRGEFDFDRYEAVVNGAPAKLTQKEWALLGFLLERENAVVSRDEILTHVWSADESPTNRTVDNFIMRLRKVIEQDPKAPCIIQSVRGVGYKLVRDE